MASRPIRLILLVLLALVASPSSSFAGGEKTTLVQVTSNWSIAIPSSFTTAPHPDSWQAYDDHRVIYISALTVGGGDTPVGELAATGEQWLAEMLRQKGTGKTEAKSEKRAGATQGHALTFAGAHGPMLIGFMAAKGTMVVCLINFDDVRYRAWAVDTWRSLQAR